MSERGIRIEKPINESKTVASLKLRENVKLPLLFQMLLLSAFVCSGLSIYVSLTVK
ncbi:MAG: hypothetical protein PHN49_02185 [Candidatus Omnitrophica bacterium]|nr:hypothetical protein [Candidatus Omnitrophota bacterium]MDD5670428.1 hypothetical protein [Candidatus Omnitrophota bacterium]